MPDLSPDDTLKNLKAPDVTDLTAIIDVLWKAWAHADQATLNTVITATFQPNRHSSLHARITTLNGIGHGLLQSDDFLQALYKEGVPPNNLYIANGALQGVSSSTKELRTLQTTHTTLIESAGSLHSLYPFHTDVSLANAIAHYQQDAVPILHTRGDLSRTILSLERTITESIDLPGEEHDVLKALDSISTLKSQTIRYVNELDPLLRPSPRSQLGNRLMAARQALLKLSGNEELQKSCKQFDLDPWQLCFSRDGKLKATGLSKKETLEIQETYLSTPPLSEVIGTLQDLSKQLNTELSSVGTLRLSRVLDYYSISHDIRLADWGTDESLDKLQAQLKQRLAQQEKKLRNTRHLDSHAERQVQSAVCNQLIQALWSAHDQNLSSPIDLMKIDFNGPSNSRLQKEWQRAQHLLFDLCRASGFWLLARRWNLSINSLAVTGTAISLSEIDNPDRRTTFLPKDFEDDALKGKIKSLLRLAHNLGNITPAALPSLSSALVFHYKQPLPKTPPLPLERSRLSSWQALILIDDLYQNHVELSGASYYLDEKRDLEEIRALLPNVKDTASFRYRPSTGTLLAKKTSQALRDFLTLRPLLSPTDPNRAEPFYYTARNASGEFVIKRSGDPAWSLDASAVNDDQQSAALEMLRSTATLSRLCLSSDGKILFREALDYYLPSPPDTRTDTPTLAHAIDAQIGLLGCGFRHDLIDASKLLDQADNDTLRKVTTRFLKKNNCTTTLFEFLGNQVLTKDELSWHDTDRWLYFLYRMISCDSAHALMDRMLKALHWYTSPTRPGSAVANASVLIHTLLLDLDPPSSRLNKKLLGYYLNKEQNNGKLYTEIYSDFRNHVKSLGLIRAEAIDMLCVFVANRIAPEVLTKDTGIRHGASLITAEYVSAVYLAEALAGGSSRVKTTRELLSMADELRQETGDNEAENLIIQQRWQAALLWENLRKGKVTFAEASLDEQRAKDALGAFEERKAQVKQALLDIKNPVPDRRSIVKQEIQRVFPQYPEVFSQEPWDTPNITLFQNHETIEAYPFHEIYAAGEIPEHLEDWTLAIAEPPLGQYQAELKLANQLRKQAYARIKARSAELGDIKALFEKQFDEYVSKLSLAYRVLSEEALFQLPERMISALYRGDFEMFTLRPPATDLEAQQESPALTNRLRGRFGVLLKITEHKTTTYYQFLPLQGVCLALPEGILVPVGGKVVERKVRTPKGTATISVREGTSLPVDWHAYLMGTSPNPNATSTLIVEPLTVTSPLPARDSDEAPAFSTITQALVDDLLLSDKELFRQLSWGETSFEKDRKKGPLSHAVDILVPFVENIRTLINARPALDPNHFSSAAFWLYAEAILLAIPFSRSLSKLLNSSRGLKPSTLAEVSLKSTLEALNPASGFISSIKLVSLASFKGYQLSHRQFFKQYRRFRLSSAGWHCQNGVALLRHRFTSLLLPSAQGVDSSATYHLMIRSTGSGAGCYLVDPASLAAYGPLLEKKSIYDAAGVMSNVLVKSQSLIPGSLTTKVLTSSKSITRLHEEEERDSYDELFKVVSPRI